MSLKPTHLDDKINTYEYFYQNNVCRLCWNAINGTKSIMDHSTAEKILEYVGIDVTAGTPNKVCNICIHKVESFIDFKKYCQNAERKLKIILSEIFQENYDNPVVVKKEADLELKLLVGEIRKEKLDALIIKPEEESKFKFQTNELCCDYNDLLPKDDDYCYICSLNFNSKQAKAKHNLKCHKTNEKSFKSKKEFKSYSRKIVEELMICKANEFTCNVCTQNFQTYDSFESHMRSHEKSEQCQKPIHGCQKCFMTFKTGDILRKHMHTHKRDTKSKIEKFVCEVCGQVYSKSNFYVHMLVHTKYKQHKCPHCDYRASLKASLNTHLKLHTGERTFACDRCHYRCITSSNLIRHRKTHTVHKEYSCYICKKSYRQNASLRDHISSVHQRERKHKCKQCRAQYFHFKGLRNHMLVKHSQKVWKVVI